MTCNPMSSKHFIN